VTKIEKNTTANYMKSSIKDTKIDAIDASAVFTIVPCALLWPLATLPFAAPLVSAW